MVAFGQRFSVAAGGSGPWPRTCASIFAWAASSWPCSFSQSSARWSMAALRKKASMVGAGPLMVMLTLVVGQSRSKPE